MTAVPIQSLNPVGITLTYKYNDDLFVARGSLLERFKVLDEGFNKVLIVADYYTYNVLELYDSVPTSEKVTPAKNTQYCICDQSKMIISVSSENQLTFIHLGLKKSHSLPFRQGQVLSIASYREYFAVLAQVSPLHAGTVLNNFRNIRSTYLAVYSTQNKKVVEVQRVTQLPYDAYKVFSGPDGFVVASPKQLIFKSFRQSDGRVRFARHPEENPQSVEDRLGEFLGAYLRVDMGFDFSNLTQCKHYTALEDNAVRENELMPTSDIHGLPLAPPQLVPASPCPEKAESFRYYGYDPREINLKLNQLINVVGDFPVFDYTLQVELGNLSNQKYLGMRACFQNWFEITPIYTADLIFIDSQHAILANCMQGLLYLVKLDPHNAANTKITPVTIADRNLPLQNENVICGLQLLSVANKDGNQLVPDIFDESKEVPAWNVLLYSSIGDSYVMHFQLTTSVPPAGYYRDYRHEIDGNFDEMFRKQLYEQLRGSCKMLNVSEDTGYERAYEEFKQKKRRGDEAAESVEFAGVAFKLNKFVMDQLYTPHTSAQHVSIFTANKGLHGEEYAQEDHLVAQPIAVIPSFAGVIDSTAKLKRAPKTLSASLVTLHYSGCIQTIKQSLTVAGTHKIIDKMDDPVSSIFNVYEDGNQFYMLATYKSAAELYKVSIQDNGAPQITKQHDLSKIAIKDTVITSKQVNSGFIIVTVKDIIFYKTPQSNPTVYNVAQHIYGKRVECAQSASVLITASGNVVVEMCFEKDVYYHDLTKDKKTVMNITKNLEYYTQSETFINASNSFCPQQCGLSALFQYNNADGQVVPYLLISTLYSEDGIVWIIGLRHNYETDVLGIFSLYNKIIDKQDENSTITFAEIVPITFTQDIESDILSYIESEDLYDIANKYLLPFQVSQLHFERVQVPGTDKFNVYMFAALYGGGIYAYVLENNYGMNTRFKRVFNLSGQLNETKGKENRWATLLMLDKCDFRVIQTKFVEKVVENGIECLYFGYPQPAGHIEPASYFAVPTLFGSYSFYQLGRAPSAIRTLENGVSQHMNSDQVPVRRMIQHRSTGIYIMLVDFNEMKPKDLQPQLNGAIFSGQQVNFGTIQSTLLNLPLNKTCSRFPDIPVSCYLASLGNNARNAHRMMLMLPFCAQRFCHHVKSDCYIVVATTPRYEIRPYHSITIDEVANIRIFNVVEDEYESGRKEFFKTEEECIEFCHKLIPRDPAPFNTHSIINHEHVFLIGHNQILDHLPVEFNKTEHINAVTAGQIESKYPQTYTKSWVSAYSQQDKFGRNDRRCKNSEEMRRSEALQGKTIKQERRELVFIGTGYLMGNFNKQYGKIYVCTIEAVQQEKQPQSGNVEADNFPNTSSVPNGERFYQLNLISQEEFQNAVTAVIVQTQSSCVLIAQAKLINGYYFTDGQKLVKCHSTPGFVYISHFAKFQDFVMITDHNYDTKLWVWRDRGKRLTQIGGRSRDSAVIAADFLVNGYEREMLCCYQFASQMGLYHYKYNSEKPYFEKLMLKQIINTPETVIQLVKVVTSIPEPSDQSIGSSVALLLVDSEGGIIQLIPTPETLFQRLGVSKSFLDVDGEFKALYADQVAGNIINQSKRSLNDLEQERIYNRIASTKGIF